MPDLSRTGISLEQDLLAGFDKLIARRGYKNRSEAVRDMIREALLADRVNSDQPVVGTLTLVYDHQVPNLAQRLTEMQHESESEVIAATHVHLDQEYCLEVIIMRGRANQIQTMADQMLAMRGVELGKLVLTNSGASLTHDHHHPHTHSHK